MTAHPTPTDPASEAVSALREAPPPAVEYLIERCRLRAAMPEEISKDTLNAAADILSALLADIAALRTRAEEAERSWLDAQANGEVYRDQAFVAQARAEAAEALSTTLTAELAALRTRAKEAERERDRMAVRRMQWADLADEAAKDANEQAANLRAAEALSTTLAAELAESRAEVARLMTARPIAEWHEDDGFVTWWKFPVAEPAWIGSPNDSDWPGYHTHWTPHPPCPAALKPEGASDNDPA